MARELEFFFDYGSPFSYLADSQLKGLAEAHRRARDLPADAARRGIQGDRQLLADRDRGQAQIFEYRSGALGEALRGGGASQCALSDQHDTPDARGDRGRAPGVFPAYHRAIYDAFWRDGLNLGDAAVVREVLQRAGLDAERIAAASEEPAVKDALRVSTETAVARGAFGAPTFFVGDQMFWGNDRLMFVEQALSALS